MKTSEMIEQLQDALKENGDQEIVIMIYGKSFDEIEFNASEDELYIEGYLPEGFIENMFLGTHVNSDDEWIG